MAKAGDLVRTRRGWEEVTPTHCPNGHELRPGHTIVSYQPCITVGGHRTWTCECDGTVYAPSMEPDCKHDNSVRCDW